MSNRSARTKRRPGRRSSHRPPAAFNPTIAEIDRDYASYTREQREALKRVITGLGDLIKMRFDGLSAEIAKTAAPVDRAIREHQEEAERLFDAVDGADLPTIIRYVEANPPSPGAIGFLVLVARDKYDSRQHSESAKAPRPKTLLRELVEDILRLNPGLTWKHVLQKLEGAAGKGVVLSVENGTTIRWRDRAGRERTSPASGLPSLVSRVKKSA